MLSSIHQLMNDFANAIGLANTKSFPIILPDSYIKALMNSTSTDKRLTGPPRDTVGFCYNYHHNTHEIMSWESIEEALQKAEKYDILIAQQED